MKKMIFSITIILFLLIFSSCKPGGLFGPIINNTPSIYSSKTSIKTTIYTLSYTYKSTNTTTPTDTSTKTITPTYTNYYTMTPLPTINGINSESTIQKLLFPNNRCELPCWWGIKAGETTWQYVKQYFSSLSCKIVFFNPHDGSYYTDGDTDVNIGSHLADITCGKWEIGITLDYGVVSWVTVYREDASNYPLSQVLFWNPTPSNIYVLTSSPEYPEFENESPFELFLYYQNERTLIYYIFIAKEYGDYIVVCPGYSAPMINIWSTIFLNNRKWKDSDAFKAIGLDINNKYILTIEEATNMEIKTFKERYKGDISNCIKTPKELWP